MTTRLRLALLPTFALTLAACYHQVVRSGLPPSSTVIERPWVRTWVFGLVPAKPIDLRQECPGGAAVVETQQTFLNGLVGALTLGIFTPQSVRVTCAAAAGAAPSGAAVFEVDHAAPARAREAAFDRAVAYARAHDAAVVLRF